MIYNQMTYVPNLIFDAYLFSLSEAELKVLLVIIRQTLGWKDRRTGQRKVRDRLTGSQFRNRTGMSKRVITTAVQSLVEKNLISVTDYNGNLLASPLHRKGKTYLYYAVQLRTLGSAKDLPAPAQKHHHNKRNYQKKINSRDGGKVRHISEIVFSKFPKARP